jgi:SRSO17 transposase
MLPECRNEGDCFSVPAFSVEKNDIKRFMGELRKFHSRFQDCFERKEPAENFFRYMAGQLSDSERKSAEPIATHIKGGSVRSVQRMLTDAVWREDKITNIYRGRIAQEMGDPDGIMIVGESGFPKKGNDSVGVAGQYCGSPGKVENSQVGVSAAYASPHGYALADKRLFIPEKRFGDEYTAGRKKCGIPNGTEFGTKPQSASEIIEELTEVNILPFRYIVADCLYGNSPESVEAPDRFTGKIFSVSTPSDTRVWFQPPVVRTEEYRSRKETELRHTVSEEPVSVSKWAEGLSGHFRYKRKVSEGTEGPIAYEFTKREVTPARNGLPWKRVWLIIRRTVGQERKYSYYISNAPISSRLKTFVWLSGIRWAIGQCFEETKTEPGMDQYEVRKYNGWNRHILICMPAHFFLRHLKIRLKKSPRTYTVSGQNSDKNGIADKKV